MTVSVLGDKSKPYQTIYLYFFSASVVIVMHRYYCTVWHNKHNIQRIEFSLITVSKIQEYV